MNDEWYYGEDGNQRGPVTLAEVRERLARGALRGEDLVWRAGLPEWVPASSVPELAAAAAPPAGPPPFAPPPPPFAPPPPLSYPPAGMAYAGYDPAAMRLRSRANTSLVLGILSIVLGPCCCSPVGIGLAIAAILLGRNARGAPNAGSATAGLVCGIVGLVLCLGSCGFSGANFMWNPNARNGWSHGTMFYMPHGR